MFRLLMFIFYVGILRWYKPWCCSQLKFSLPACTAGPKKIKNKMASRCLYSLFHYYCSQTSVGWCFKFLEKLLATICTCVCKHIHIIRTDLGELVLHISWHAFGCRVQGRAGFEQPVELACVCVHEYRRLQCQGAPLFAHTHRRTCSHIHTDAQIDR